MTSGGVTTTEGDAGTKDAKFKLNSGTYGNVYGGYSTSETVGSNTVTISGGTIGSDSYGRNVYGGYTTKGAAINNTVNLLGGEIKGYSEKEYSFDDVGGNVYGGYTKEGDATENTVTFSGGTSKQIYHKDGKPVPQNGQIYGGYTEKGNANNNRVTVDGVDHIGACGGYTNKGNANNNTVTLKNITPGEVNGGNIYGGFVNGVGTEGDANNNTVTIKNGDNIGSVYAGYVSNKGMTAKDNKVYIEGGTIENVYGSKANDQSANLESNEVTISGKTTITDSVYGSRSGGNGYVKNNKVIISGGTIKQNVYGGEKHGSGTKNETGIIETGIIESNEVIIKGGKIEQNVYGSSSVKDTSGKISDKDMKNNKVTISGGEITGDVYGAYSEGPGNIENNEVIITGGTIGKNVYGSMSKGSGVMGNNNTVTLGDKDNPSGKATITGNVYLQSTDYTTAAPGGILNVYNVGNSVDNLYAKGKEENPSTLNFYINSTDMNQEGSKTMLTVTVTADITGATIKAGIRNVGSVQKGDKIILLSAGTLTADDKLKTGLLTDGFMEADLQITKEEKSIIATAGKDAVAKSADDSDEDKKYPARKSPVETMAASITLLNTGADMVAGESFTNAAAAVSESQAEGDASSMAPFASIGGSSQRVKSGSHCDVKAWNINLGFAKEITNKQGKLMFGPIIEYGHGFYDSYLDNGIHGKGSSSFAGVGLMAKQTNTDGFYYEGSLRIGRAKSDYRSNFGGDTVSYDTSALYYALHVGAGQVQPVGKHGDTIDYYGKLFYSHQNGDRASLSNGYDYDFKAVDSVRSKLGFRYNHKVNTMSTIYGGLAWQHEFDGKAKATGINTLTGDTFQTPSPSVEGDTGIIELGCRFKSGNDDSFETSLGLTGTIGKQTGVGVNASFQWKF